jgi:SAM-dependent methyltransferase
MRRKREIPRRAARLGMTKCGFFPQPLKPVLQNPHAVLRYSYKSEDRSTLTSASKTAPNRGVLHPFDQKYGTDTGGYLGPEDLVKGGTNDAHNHGYSAIAPSVFNEACRRWRETLPGISGRIEAYSFVDVGAGKGRALLLASQLPFRKVIGVELSEELSRIAQENVARWSRVARPETKIRVVRQDAANFQWPRTPLLVYLYNPFACSLIASMAESLASIAKSGSGVLDLLYVNPTCADTLESQGRFDRLWTARISMSDGDQKADPYGTASDLVSAYRLK